VGVVLSDARLMVRLRVEVKKEARTGRRRAGGEYDGGCLGGLEFEVGTAKECGRVVGADVQVDGVWLAMREQLKRWSHGGRTIEVDVMMVVGVGTVTDAALHAPEWKGLSHGTVVPTSWATKPCSASALGTSSPPSTRPRYTSPSTAESGAGSPAASKGKEESIITIRDHLGHA
jgi:hypothetical protein